MFSSGTICWIIVYKFVCPFFPFLFISMYLSLHKHFKTHFNHCKRQEYDSFAGSKVEGSRLFNLACVLGKHLKHFYGAGVWNKDLNILKFRYFFTYPNQYLLPPDWTLSLRVITTSTAMRARSFSQIYSTGPELNHR